MESDAGEKKNKGGRPPDLTHEIIEEICSYIRQGSLPRAAARALGVNDQTWDNWTKKGRIRNRINEGTIYGTLQIEMAKAVAKAEVIHLNNINKAAAGQGRYQKPDWKASAWLLERLNPERWAGRQKLEHTGPEGGPMQLEKIETLSDEDLEARIAALKAKAGVK